ncbi:histidine kinase [Foetidibacter luteolus]|uniref:histidine kinase n=1 Tax=Foetidibacter luteolus TaxID=2608880 RepID=UPI00129BB5E8|nr:histidine kinase [Foetidibacter luteolus]
MTLDALIFSNSRNYRRSRHFIFWFAWILYYATVSALLWKSEYGFMKAFVESFMEVTVSTPLDMLFCYFIIYYLLPQFLFRGRYIAMVLLWVLASFVIIIAFELYFYYCVPFIRELNGMPVPMPRKNIMGNFFSLFSQINMEGCLAAAIKLGKLWYIKQQEVELLKEEKAKNEAEVEKGHTQPFFLADILERVEQVSEQKPSQMPVLMKKIKSLLVYALYENNLGTIAIAKELQLLNEYIELSKATASNPVEITLYTEGDMMANRIAPFIILPVTENAFKHVSLLATEHKKLHINISADNGNFNMRLTWNKPPDTSTLTNGSNIILQNISRRLNLIYPQSHELKVLIEVDQVIISLYINLRKAITK